MHTIRLLLSVVVVAFPTLAFAEAKVELMRSFVLKHRIQIVAPPPAERLSQGSNTLDLTIKDVDKLNKNNPEGISIAAADWATGVDLVKKYVDQSKVIRLLEQAPDPGIKSDLPRNQELAPLILYTRFGHGPQGSVVFLRLIKRADGKALYSSDARAETLSDAVKSALSELEDQLVRRAWRCRVRGVREDLLIIDRGRLDGVQLGQRFYGYSIATKTKETDPDPEEGELMQYGTRKGVYEVVLAGEETSQVKSVDGSPKLEPGDVLEMPEAKLLDRGSPGRASRVLDDIYNKKKAPGTDSE